MNPKITIYDCETCEQIVREMTNEELQNYEIVGENVLAP